MDALYHDCLRWLRDSFALTMGCTEPGAVALAGAQAASLLPSPPIRLEVEASSNFLKNGMHVGIPGTSWKGLAMAAVLGAQIAEPSLSLNIFSAASADTVSHAEAMLEAGAVTVTERTDCGKVHVQVAAVSADGHEAVVRMADSHTGFASMTLDGKIVTHAIAAGECRPAVARPQLTLEDALSFSAAVSPEDISFFSSIVRQQWDVAEHGLRHAHGLQVGMRLQDAPEHADASVYTTCAAVDARMDGCMLPVYALAGSGNNGLTATLPVIALAKKRGDGNSRLYRALTLSTLVTLLVKSELGPVSSLCGCSVAAAIGSCAGMTWLYGAERPRILYAINLMVADVSGMICDGAKPGCSLKIATAVASASRAAYLASRPRTPIEPLYGITQPDAAQSLKNLGTLENEGMPNANELILNMMRSASASTRKP